MNLLLLLILGSIWGTSFLFIKIVVSEIGPLTLVAGRLGLAALSMGLLLWLRRVPLSRERGSGEATRSLACSTARCRLR
jgi:drug/metabolite transporter (DMT)-like permease